MKYHATEYEVDNGDGIPVSIYLDPERPIGGPDYFRITQDCSELIVTQECLQSILHTAKLLLSKDGK